MLSNEEIDRLSVETQARWERYNKLRGMNKTLLIICVVDFFCRIYAHSQDLATIRHTHMIPYHPVYPTLIGTTK